MCWIWAAARAPMPVGLPRAAGPSSRLTSRIPRCSARLRQLTPGLGGRIEFVQHDLSDTFPDGTFDLISAQFLHSMIPFDRPRVLRHAAGAVRAGGLLLIVDHAGPPPWASKLDHQHDFPSAEEVVGSLDLDDGDWERVRVEAVERQATGPDGETAVWVDLVIVLRRRGGD